jgi:hypothetical protein
MKTNYFVWSGFRNIDIFLTVLPLDVWNLLFTEQPASEEWHIAIGFGPCPGLKGYDL